MATKVPISVENIAFERLDLSRHYLTIDCDFTCFLVLNPSGSVPSEGTDICALHVGAWQIDAWTLLTKKDFPNQAGFSACLVWDKTLVVEGSSSVPHVVESDIDTANSVSTLKGQPVNITGFSMPDGGSLPASLVFGSDDGPVSRYNPLPVITYPFELYMTAGGEANYPLLNLVSAIVNNTGPVTRYRMSPRVFQMVKPAERITYNYSKFVEESSGQARSFLSASCPVLVAIVDNETHLYTSFEISVRGVPLYTNPASVVEFNTRDNTPSFWIYAV